MPTDENHQDEPPPSFLSAACEQVEAYLTGAAVSLNDLPLDLNSVTVFSADILRATRAIPYGSVCTYTQVAANSGHTGASRAAGGALGRNPIPIIIPCHRVLAADRHLHGFSAPGGLSTKAWLLRLEGHHIVNQKLD